MLDNTSECADLANSVVAWKFQIPLPTVQSCGKGDWPRLHLNRLAHARLLKHRLYSHLILKVTVVIPKTVIRLIELTYGGITESVRLCLSSTTALREPACSEEWQKRIGVQRQNVLHRTIGIPR